MGTLPFRAVIAFLACGANPRSVQCCQALWALQRWDSSSCASSHAECCCEGNSTDENTQTKLWAWGHFSSLHVDSISKMRDCGRCCSHTPKNHHRRIEQGIHQHTFHIYTDIAQLVVQVHPYGIAVFPPFLC